MHSGGENLHPEIAAVIAAGPEWHSRGSARFICDSRNSALGQAFEWGFQYAMIGNAVGKVVRSKQRKAKWCLR